LMSNDSPFQNFFLQHCVFGHFERVTQMRIERIAANRFAKQDREPSKMESELSRRWSARGQKRTIRDAISL
jgi:hypothetical protein